MAGQPHRQHDPVALDQAIAIALAVARQLNQDVYVQRCSARGRGYPVMLASDVPRNRLRRNCYRINPAGDITPFPGNPPYVAARSEGKRKEKARQLEMERQDWLARRERAFREAEKKLGALLLSREEAGLNMNEFLVKESSCDEHNLRGACILEGPGRTWYTAYVSIQRLDEKVRVLMVGPADRDREKAAGAALAWVNARR